ncbi:16968_t:CDS:2 [Funneliformis geosporum]|nr:16968_t:CDS:2 [Funneliformis geosporum]
MNMNLRLFFTRKKDICCKSIHLFRSAINSSNIINTQQTLKCKNHRPFDFRTLYNSSNEASSNLTSQSIHIKQTIGRLWRSQLTVIKFPLDEKKEITDESKMTCEKISHHSNKKISINDLILEGKRQFNSAFMPKGYPDSVTKDYWEFAKWQFLHNIAGSVTGVLSTQSLLYAMGLGSTSIPLAAALNWIIKDGLGQLGGVIYAASINDRFDSEPKRHRFRATVSMQFASFLELLAPLWPGMFLLIASASNIGKNIAWLAGSATRATMHKSFALRDNLGDITGKSGSQSTAAGTALGVVISATITKFQPDFATITPSTFAAVQPIIPIFITFIPFSIFNIYANYKSSLNVTTSTLNIPRAEMILYRLLNKLGGETRTLSRIKCDLRDLVPSPKEISSEEIFVKRYYSPFEIPLEIEPALHHYTSKKYARDLHAALKQEGFLHPEEYFILHVPNHHLFGDNIFHYGFRKMQTLRILSRDSLTHVQLDMLWIEDSFTDLINTLESKEWETEHLFFTEKDDHRLFVEK